MGQPRTVTVRVEHLCRHTCTHPLSRETPGPVGHRLWEPIREACPACEAHHRRLQAKGEPAMSCVLTRGQWRVRVAVFARHLHPRIVAARDARYQQTLDDIRRERGDGYVARAQFNAAIKRHEAQGACQDHGRGADGSRADLLRLGDQLAGDTARPRAVALRELPPARPRHRWDTV